LGRLVDDWTGGDEAHMFSGDPNTALSTPLDET
jgi:hypothetical protein